MVFTQVYGLIHWLPILFSLPVPAYTVAHISIIEQLLPLSFHVILDLMMNVFVMTIHHISTISILSLQFRKLSIVNILLCFHCSVWTTFSFCIMLLWDYLGLGLCCWKYCLSGAVDIGTLSSVQTPVYCLNAGNHFVIIVQFTIIHVGIQLTNYPVYTFSHSPASIFYLFEFESIISIFHTPIIAMVSICINSPAPRIYTFGHQVTAHGLTAIFNSIFHPFQSDSLSTV